MYKSIEVRMVPINAAQARFLMSRSVGDFEEKKYSSKADVADSPVAEALLEVAGIKEVVIAGNAVTVVTDDSAPDWSKIESEVNSVVNKVSEQQHDAAGGAGDGAKADEVTFNLVEEMFRTHINPALGGHGGSVELIDVQDGIVTVRMMGGCQGCGMARVTLQQGVQATLQKAIPAVKGVRDITDHAAGTAPYSD